MNFDYKNHMTFIQELSLFLLSFAVVIHMLWHLIAWPKMRTLTSRVTRLEAEVDRMKKERLLPPAGTSPRSTSDENFGRSGKV